MTRSLAVVHNNIDGDSAIGAIAAWAVRAGLARGWQVSAVCHDLDPDLRAEVSHCPLYVPPRSHLLQWSVARPTVRRALRGRRPDAVLVYQPQVAAIADVWHVEYLSRAARRVAGPPRPGVRSAVRDLEAAGVARLEDSYLRRLPASTRVLFCSERLRADYAALYGEARNAGVLHNPALLEGPPPGHVLPNLRLRHELTGCHPGPVVGFLGGGDLRKGADLVAAAVAADPELFLLHAGPGRLNDSDPRLAGRSRGLGMLADVTGLLDAVDVLLVPSRFEPFGLVVAEAAARGVPVLVSPVVGAAALVLESGAGAVWAPGEPLGPAVAALIADRERIATAAHELTARLDPARLADQLFDELDAACLRKSSGAR